MEDRIFSTMHFSRTILEIAWEKTTPFYRGGLKISCGTEEKDILKRWLDTNSVAIETNIATKEGMSFQEVVEWVKSA